MRSAETPDCIAIDGGGTRCRFALSLNGSLHTVEAGQANVSTDFAGAVSTINEALHSLARQSGTDVGVLTALPAFVGLAGVTGPALIDRLRASLPFTVVRYADDRPAALRGALGASDGIVAHCGTGSFFAAQLRGRTRLSGGWGPVLGDEGSAQLLGRRLLWFALQHVDGFQAGTPLVEKVLSQFGGAPEVVAFAGRAKPNELGALSPLVTEAAEAQDPAALYLLKEAADLVERNIRQLGWTPGTAICLTGGVAPFYEPFLPDEMRRAVRPSEAEPIDGAIALARDLAREQGA